ncbi:hypothetical protein [Nocardia sp. NBC_01009]|uniref:hypothetical protein n=1 Tax=Nocardia sp. NBC_01009 TaxID=2975996 RepID=UPI00386E7A3D|nr:hypothetical protein OHA42_20730 [Nocardia sp. NBC_01009]
MSHQVFDDACRMIGEHAHRFALPAVDLALGIAALSDTCRACPLDTAAEVTTRIGIASVTDRATPRCIAPT